MSKLGKKYKDVVTGFEGVATGHVQYIDGSEQMLITPPVNEKGDMRDAMWIGVQRLQ